MAAGTAMLVAGMLVCAHVVESGSEEVMYRVKLPRMQARFIWLQRGATVNDQSFRPFAICARNSTQYYTTSRRRPKDGSWRILQSTSMLGVKAVVGTAISLSGFVTQFIGLRAIHWSISVSQLGATIFMAIVRAWVRRGLAKPSHAVLLESGHELDWLAMTLGHGDKHELSDLGILEVATDQSGSSSQSVIGITKEDSRARSRPPGVETQASPPGDQSSRSGNFRAAVRWSGRIETGRDRSKLAGVRVGDDMSNELGEVGSPASDSVDNAQQIMMPRRDLGKISNWPGVASKEAVSVARSIEGVWNIITSTKTDAFSTNYELLMNSRPPELL